MKNKKSKKPRKKKSFVFEITATQQFSMLWDIEAVSREAATTRIFKQFKDIKINRQWSSGSLEDNKKLSPYWTPTDDAEITLDVLNEYD